MSVNGKLYRLINSVHIHDGPIRCLSVISNTSEGSVEIFSGCQSDAPNVRKWNLFKKSDFVEEINEIGTPIYHDHWVTALTSLPPDSNRLVYPNGCLITGCMDTKIRIYDFSTGLLVSTLAGHTKGCYILIYVHI